MAPPARADAQALEHAIDFAVRRVTYSALAGAAAAVMLFRTPGAATSRCLRTPCAGLTLPAHCFREATRAAALAFGAGVGAGSAFTGAPA